MNDRPMTGTRPPFPPEIAAGGVVLTLTSDQLYVAFADTVTPRESDALLARYRLQPVQETASTVPPKPPEQSLHRERWLRSTSGSDLAPTIAELRAIDQVRSVSPVYQRADLLPMLTGHGFADELLVRFAPTVSPEEARTLIADTDTSVVALFPDERGGPLYHLRLGTSQLEVFNVTDEFARSPLVRYAGPNWLQLQSPALTTPNDPDFPLQLNLARIDAPAGWDITQGSADVVIAIVDSGCDLTHPDLVNQYVPMADRFDAIANSNTPNDPVDHGTLCAGVAAAQTDNMIGVAGVAPNCRIMPIRMWQAVPPTLSETWIVAAIDWARTHGADVINMSWAFTGPHANADIALDNASAAGLVLVAASGNCRRKDPCTDARGVVFPATHRDVIAVGATDASDHWKQRDGSEPDPWDSRYGPELSVMAPSPIPWTTGQGGGFEGFIGTSAAAPHVAGLAALIVSLKPRLSPQQVRTIIESTAEKVGGVAYANDPAHPNGTWFEKMGYGRINVARALEAALGAWTLSTLAPAGSAAATGIAAVSRMPGTMELWWIAPDGSVQGAKWYEGGQPWSLYELAPAGSAAAPGIAAVSRIPSSMEVWWIAPDGSVRGTMWYESSPQQRWGEPYTLAPAGSAAASGLAAVSRIPSSMELWWIAPDGSVQGAYWYEGGQPWSLYELAPAASATATGLAAVSRRPGTMELWWIAPDGSVQGAYWYEGGQPWGRYTLAPVGSATSTGLAAVSRIPSSMELWWIAPDGSVQGAYWYEGGQPWGRYMLAPAGNAAAPGIAAVSRIPSSMELWWVGPDGSVRGAKWYEGGQPWSLYELAPAGSAAAPGIAAVSRIPNSLEVWWLAPDGSVRDAIWYE